MKTTYLAAILFLCACCTSPSTSPPSGIKRQVISTARAPEAVGPYSQAISIGKTLYLAGQIGLDPQSGIFVEGGIEAQTRRVMENLKAVLKEAGFSLSDVVQTQIFISDMKNYHILNKIYGEYFSDSPPARAVVEVNRLPLGALVEIMMTAAKTE